MINNILNVDGVKELSKDELKKTNGGKINCVEIPGTMEPIEGAGGVNVGVKCKWDCKKTFLGIKINEEIVWGGCKNF
ncbi:MAG: hypothetical protein N4A72_06940 [Bacteroidales bacterium]|jgi:bacteriocin-like protein|nr:hypothetical protein [Bacteroidales bacterium]